MKVPGQFATNHPDLITKFVFNGMPHDFDTHVLTLVARQDEPTQG